MPANASFPPYTIPAVAFPDGEILQDSRVIASKLEEMFPSPTLHLDEPSLPKIQDAVLRAYAPIRPIVTPLIPKDVLRPGSVEYFERTRAERFGISLPEMAATQGGEKAWEAAVTPLKELAGLIKGPYVLGDEISYADFVVVAFLHFLQRTGGQEVREKVVSGKWDEEGKLGSLYDACKQWLIRDSY